MENFLSFRYSKFFYCLHQGSNQYCQVLQIQLVGFWLYLGYSSFSACLFLIRYQVPKKDLSPIRVEHLVAYQ